MNKLFWMLFGVAAAFAGDYFGDCAPLLGTINEATGERKPTEPTFLKGACPTQEELKKGIERYLKATNQENRPYTLIEEEHWYILHFTD